MDSLERLSMRQDFMGVYDAEKVHRKEINSARSEGYDSGYDEGVLKGKLQSAQAMFNDGVSIENISKYTGLSVEDIKKHLNKEL